MPWCEMTRPTESQAMILEPRKVNPALLLLRVGAAAPFLYHGTAILFGWFGGPGAARFAASHHWPVVVADLIGLAQVAGAAAVATGILFRIGAAFIIAIMIGAIFLVHLSQGFDVSNGGMEYALTQLLIASALLLTGPGRYSLGFLLPRWMRKL
jgi:putative oxidoreductase